MRALVLLMVMLAATAPGLAQVGTEQAVPQTLKIETTYDSGRDRTTVRMNRMQISGDKGRYRDDHLLALRGFAETLANKGNRVKGETDKTERLATPIPHFPLYLLLA